jgi:type IV secretory system conjugative DNA transfer VirD4/TraG family protein
VSRAEYARYVLARIAEASAIVASAIWLAVILQRARIVAPIGWRYLHSARLESAPWAKAAVWFGWWARPLAWAAVAHVILGPKQRRPIYLKIPGTMFAYAGVKVSRNAGCRGGCVTGATGSGKTLACIMPRLHSLCLNEAGIERPGRAGPDHPRGEQRRNPEEECRRRARFKVPPWGGFICGEKGNEWQWIGEMLRHHGREEDLCVLSTRPKGADPRWTPAVRLNLISMHEVPADTYARILVETGLAVEEAASRDEFFIPQARDKIAWGLRLVRAVRDASGVGGAMPRGADAHPSLLNLFDILTVQESYRRYLMDCTERHPALADSGPFAEARFQLENNYWNQPPDQLGGVRSTLYNFLVPFTEPEIAEVFCADSTFDLRDIQLGKVVCLAIPQKYALQRRYVATLVKTLAYQIILERFDRSADDPDWLNRNVILVEQDEWQRHAVRADCDVDVVREARGAVYAATQSQNSVWLKLGGRENAAPMIANLRNRWICQAATEDCADESSNLVSGRVVREVSYSHGDGGRTTNVTFPEKPLLPRRELRTLPPFHVIFAPAEGPWLFRRCIAMPATADGRIPHWWFGDWNPLHWLAHSLGLPEAIAGLRLHPGDKFIPPWRASAPLRAQVRRLCGLDGTFIILGGRRFGASRDEGA